VRNTASNRVLAKCGFIHEGTVRHGKMVSSYCDYHIWGMLREDYDTLPKED
jgi:ribosomal-protein-alanine N-acetyltransferase